MKKSQNTLSNYTINEKVVEEKVVEERKPIILMSPFTRTMAIVDGVIIVMCVLLLANHYYYGYFYILWGIMRFIDILSYKQQEDIKNETKEN